MEASKEKSKTDKEILTIKIRGTVTEPKCWAARYFGNFAVITVPKRYRLDVQFLFELEWIYMKRQLFADGVEVPGMGEPLCAVWVSDEYVGDDIGLCKFLKTDEYIPIQVLYDILNVSVQISKDPLDYCPRDMNRAYVYFNIDVGGNDLGRLLFEIFTDLMPNSCERFLTECIRYDGCNIHRITHNGWFESGHFDEEDPPIREKRKAGLSNYREGMLSLVNSGRTNCKSSQFLVTFIPAPFIDPYQCPIGALLDGITVLEEINKIKTHYDSPLDVIKLKNVTILYAPDIIIERNHLLTIKATTTPANVWIEEKEMITKDEEGFQLRPRIDLKPRYHQITNEQDIKINEIRLQLYKENKKLKEVIDEPRFKLIVKSVLDKEKRHGKKFIDERELKRIKEEVWYKILINADSDFDLYYQPTCVPKTGDESKDEIMEELAVINNPTIVKLLQYVKKRELNIVLDTIKKLVEQSINEAVFTKEQELYIAPPSTRDYARPLGDEMARLPSSIQDLLTEQVCNLSENAFELFRQTLRHITETVSVSQFKEEDSTISGDIMMIVMATKSYFSMLSLSEIEIIKRKESLIEDVNILSKKLLKIHEQIKNKRLKSKSLDLPVEKENFSRITF